MIDPEVLLNVARSSTQVIQDKIDLIHKLAESSFQNHVLTLRHCSGDKRFRSWRVCKPNEHAYLFNITVEPGRLFITGDIGTLVVERQENMIEWARNAVKSISYFAQKVVPEIKTDEYDSDLVKAWLYETLKQDQENEYLDEESQEALIDLYTNTDLLEDYHHVMETIYNLRIVDGCDFPDINNYTSSFLWCREALMFFIKLLDNQEQTPNPMT